MTSKIAFITGITGQDGAFLASFLLDKGYEVHGLVRWDCVDTCTRLEGLDIQLYFGDMIDANNLNFLIKTINPDEIYNLAALSHVKVSFETPSSMFDINTKGVLNILDSVRVLGLERSVRIYQASSSEMFGVSPAPQNEETPFAPCSPYGVAKLAAYWLARTYRDSYCLYVSNGILFNHESSLRGEDFVTRKITQAVAAIEAGQQDMLTLGNLDSVRDWGHARDYVVGMWLMLQQDEPDDYVLATGQAHTVREFVERAFAHIGIEILWKGVGVNEVGVNVKTGKILINIDSKLFRPKDVNYLLGDASKAKEKLGWQPEIYFDELISDMVNADRRSFLDGWESWQKAG
ncbi:MAG: GDP-mannose 4,6-dehydratase [Alphaproteobacteria bacterium]|nr:GDP-mannose 4,6-dehydratase [Alphaproteobacteria bacterium]